jgi:iron(III) transport system substrate-binding protein
VRFAPLALVLVAILGCSREPQPPIVVYVPGEDESALETVFANFSSETNIPVVPIWGDSTANTEQLISKTGENADVLITSNVADIWRAADRGALRPIQSTAFANVAPLLKDPDGFWAAIDVRLQAIAIRKEPGRPLVASYDQLASPDMRGRVCLSSSILHANRSLIAMLINDRGVKKAERLVRAWIRNLAVPPFQNQDDLLAALRGGTCDYGIVSWFPESEDIAYFLPDEGYLDITGIGVARHAQQPESAQRFVEWMLLNQRVEVSGDSDRRPVGIAGWRDEEARLLVERAGYR